MKKAGEKQWQRQELWDKINIEKRFEKWWEWAQAPVYKFEIWKKSQ